MSFLIAFNPHRRTPLLVEFRACSKQCTHPNIAYEALYRGLSLATVHYRTRTESYVLAVFTYLNVQIDFIHSTERKFDTIAQLERLDKLGASEKLQVRLFFCGHSTFSTSP